MNTVKALKKLKAMAQIRDLNSLLFIYCTTERMGEHHKTITSLYPGVHRQTGTKMFSVSDEK